MKIVLDAMGGDHAPQEIIKGAVLALNADKDIELVLTGDEEKIKKELAANGCKSERVTVVHAPEVITQEEAPASAVRTKRSSSLVVGLKLLHEREDIDAFVSAGSTGAVLAGAVMYVGRIPGVERPALCPSVPNVHGKYTLLCDAGANADCKPSYLAQFAVMASACSKVTFRTENPKVGLLSNGTEDHKGDVLHQEAFKLLKETKGINFVGNAEGRDLMFNDLDVLVADGFSGNTALKACEGCAKTVSSILKTEFKKAKFAYLCARKPLKKIKVALDYNRAGGAIFLGVKKTVIKAHGSSKSDSVYAALLQAADAVRGRLVEKIGEMLRDAWQTE